VRLAPGTARVAAPQVAPATPAAPGKGQAVLATWHELLDAGRMSDGDEYLAATAKPARALLSPATASELGESVTVSTERGSITVPVEVADMPDGVVWLPTNARGCAVRATLGAVAGDIVTIAPGGARA